VPNTLQYPLERHRDVQQRWERLLQRTAAAKVYAPAPLKLLRTLVSASEPCAVVRRSINANDEEGAQ
jgi:hypothetical protein